MSEVVHASQGYVEKIARIIAAEEVAKVVANAPYDLDTLKEIADYIASDKIGAAQMVTRIDANDNAIRAEVKRATDAEAELDKAIGKKVGVEDLKEYAKKSDIPSLDGYAKKTELVAKRDKTDNIAAADETQFTEWKFHCDVPEIQAALDAATDIDVSISIMPNGLWGLSVSGLPQVDGWVLDETFATTIVVESPDVESFTAYDGVYSKDNYSVKVGFSATRERTVFTKQGEPYVTPTGVKNIATGLVESARHELQGEISAVQSTADNALAMVEEATRDKGYSYKSPLFDKLYSLSPVHTVAVNSSYIAVPCHKGWLIFRDYGRSATIQDYYIAPDGSVTFFDGAIFGDSTANTFHLAIVKPTETVVFATATGGAFVKTTVDADCNLRREVLTELPYNVASYNNSYGISNDNGFVATTAGVILDEDTLEEVSVFSSTSFSPTSLNLKIWGGMERSDGDGQYIYCDPSTKQLTKMKLDDSGVPEFVVNTYKQNLEATVYPLFLRDNNSSSWEFICYRNTSLYSYAAIIGYNYDSGLCATPGETLHGYARHTKYGYCVSWVGDRLVMASNCDNKKITIVIDLLKDFIPRFEIKKTTTWSTYQIGSMAADRAGNVLCARFQRYHWGNDQKFVILTEK